MIFQTGNKNTIWAVRLRVPIIIVSIIITLAMLMILILKGMESDAGASSILPSDNEDYDYYEKIEDIFGSMEMIFVGVHHNESIYNHSTLEAINELTLFFEKLPESDADDIVSITKIDNMWSDYGELIIEPLFDDPENIGSADLEYIRSQVRYNPLLKGRLVSEDEKSSFIVAGFTWSDIKESEDLSRISEQAIAEYERISKKYPDTQFYLSGDIISEYRSTMYMAKDMIRLFPAAMLVVIIILLIILRHFRGMLIPITVTVCSIIWTFGLKSLLSSPLTIAESSIPVMLIAIGCADGVHIISEFLHLQRSGLSSKEAVTKTMTVLTIPVILTSITTAIGFLSLATAAGKSFKNMGLFLGFGVMVAMFLSLFLIPALLSFFGESKKVEHKIAQSDGKVVHKFSSYFRSFLKMWGSFVFHRRIPIAIFTVGIITLSVIGVLKVQVESDMLTYFHKNDPFRLATEYIKDHMGGISEIYIVVEGQKKDSLKDPRILQAMWDLQKYAESYEEVSYTQSISDYIRHMNFLIQEDEEYRRIPKETEIVTETVYRSGDTGEYEEQVTRKVEGKLQVANLLLLYEMGGGDALDDIVNHDYSMGVIKIRLSSNEDKQLRVLVADLRKFISRTFPEDVNTRFTNYYIYLITSTIIIESQITSIITSLFFILIILSLIFRSLLKGFIVLIPTFCAIFFNFGLMWIFKVRLDIATSVIASIGMGVGVDYSIHFFSRFRYLFITEQDYRKAIKKALEFNARGILSNAVAVGLGFFVLIFSNFRAIFNMGWIIGISMFTTAANALIILPALIAIFKPRFQRLKKEKKSPSP